MIGGASWPPGGCDRLHRPCIGRRVFQALHQGDGEVARRRNIGHGRSIDGADEARSKGRDLRRAARSRAAEPCGEVKERLARTGVQQDRPEEHEGCQRRRGHVDQHAPEAAVRQEDDLGQIAGIEAAVPELPGDEIAEERIANGDEHDQRKHPVGGAPRQLQDAEQGAEAHQHVPAVGPGQIGHDVLVVADDVAPRNRDHGDDRGVDEHAERAPAAALEERMHQHGQRTDRHDEERPLDQRLKRSVERCVEDERTEKYGKHGNRRLSQPGRKRGSVGGNGHRGTFAE